ncbi:hypothetical protein NQU36_29000, partial [Escherichia coli]|uniref:hypothetical protein n=1 Tax=Escherichia coli TaxID=562 RepID=UPI00211860F4
KLFRNPSNDFITRHPRPASYDHMHDAVELKTPIKVKTNTNQNSSVTHNIRNLIKQNKPKIKKIPTSPHPKKKINK